MEYEIGDILEYNNINGNMPYYRKLHFIGKIIEIDQSLINTKILHKIQWDNLPDTLGTMDMKIDASCFKKVNNKAAKVLYDGE